MAEENKSTLESAANTAQTVKSAVKVGKAVAAATKGAAAGPYGAAIGFAWGNRKTIAKIIIAALGVLMLPILFILMLPALIFRDISGASSASNPQAPILNDNATIIENMNEISFAINSILAEGIDDVVARIDDDFASSGGDRLEIINPYESDLTCNGNLFVAQYCAAKDKDFESLSLSDMESILRDGKEHLYTFSRTTELRQTAADDPDTDEDESVYETFVIYTIIYNGEGYFAGTIFHLSDEQKQLANDYASNLSLFLGDGSVQSLLEYENGYTYEGVIFSNGGTSVVYYNQGDERYRDAPYGTDYIGRYGCGPTAMAIVVSSLTDDMVDPVQMAKWAYDNDYWCSKSGSYHSLIPGAAKNWNLPVEGCTTAEPQRIVDALSSGKLVVAIMTAGHFTNSGHFIVLRGVTSDGKILVADPGSYRRSEQEWDLSIILNEASKRAGSGGPYWIMG